MPAASAARPGPLLCATQRFRAVRDAAVGPGEHSSSDIKERQARVVRYCLRPLRSDRVQNKMGALAQGKTSQLLGGHIPSPTLCNAARIFLMLPNILSFSFAATISARDNTICA